METKKGLTLADTGEFGFVDILSSRFGKNLPSDVVIGIGDDVAVLDVGGSDYLLATCDSQVSDVHFPRDLIPPYDLGWRIVEVNISDIAAMGGMPRWALVGLNVSAQTSLDFLEEFYSGIGDALSHVGACLVGGNCARTREEMVIDLFLMGTVPRKALITRRGASPGDVIFVTGSLGKARAGLEVVLGEVSKTGRLENAIFDRAKEFFFRPQARLREGQMLAGSGFVTAMIDVSDGLLQDVRHLARENGLDAVLDLTKIPVDPVCVEVAKAVEQDPLVWAVTGGEDYELLFAVTGERAGEFIQSYENNRITAISGEGKEIVPVNAIGRFEKGSGKVLLRYESGRLVPSDVFASGSGWDHYK